MNTGTRLGLYGAVLAVTFGGAYATAAAVVPQSTVDSWTARAQAHQMPAADAAQAPAAGHGEHAVRGLAAGADGFLLSPVQAPGRVGERGTLSFQVSDADGHAVTDYTREHDKELHLIVVRTDGTQFRHVHPTRDADGTWSLPWQWAAAGSYRMYADFVPAAQGSDGHGAAPVTLTRTVDVAGAVTPVAATPTRTASADGYTVALAGDLAAGSSSTLTFTVTRDGESVTTLEPYLGAFGHLVALRDGDLAFLHVHPGGDEPVAGRRSGPAIRFSAEVPTTGRYLLYLDFQVDGQVHSAPFVLDTTAAHGH